MKNMINSRKTIIAIILIAFAGIIGISWYLGLIGTVDNSVPKEMNFSNVEYHSLYPGKYYVNDIEIGIPLVKDSEKMMVYSKQEISNDEILHIASNLGIKGKPEISEDGWISIRDSPLNFISQPGGRVITCNDETPIPGFTPEYIDSHLPSDDEAKKIADNFLLSHNIDAEGMKFVGTNHAIGYFLKDDDKMKCKESINVVYRHFIDNYEIYNDDLILEVTINNTVNHIFWKWSRYKPYREYSIISPEKAIDQLYGAGIVVLEDMDYPEKATVLDINLGYLGETREKDIDYLIPVYKIEGEVSGDGTTKEFFQYIPASSEAMDDLI
jgi:hypothetical protein